MPDDTTNVVPLKRRVSPQGWGPREADALLVAQLAAMSGLDYERARVAAARKLRCRASWLDATIEAIRGRVDKFRHLPSAKEDQAAGTSTYFIYDDGSRVVGFLVGAYRRFGEEHHFLILADGDLTLVGSKPVRKDRAMEENT